VTLDAVLELNAELKVDLTLVVVCGLLIVVDVDSVALKLQTNKQTNKKLKIVKRYCTVLL